MKLSVRSIYGVRFMLGLAQNINNGPMQLSSLSKTKNISEKYLSQIVIPLRHANLITSTRGAKGGYILSKPPEKITVKEIVECLEGDLNIVDIQEHKNEDYSIELVWKDLNNNIQETLGKYTLLDLINIEMKKKNELIYVI